MSKTLPTQSVPSTETGHVSEAWQYTPSLLKDGNADIRLERDQTILIAVDIPTVKARAIVNSHNISLDSASPWIKTADTERLDWIEQQNGCEINKWIRFDGDEYEVKGNRDDKSFFHKTFREAIDAARSLSADVQSSNAGGVPNPKSDAIPPVPQQQKP